MFTRFLRQSITIQSTPVFILHGIFGSKMNWRSIGNKLMMETNRPVRSNSLKLSSIVIINSIIVKLF